MTIRTITADCIVCNETNCRFFVEKNGFCIYRCARCGLLFIHPIPKNASFIYGEDYFNGGKEGFGYPDYQQEKIEMASTFDTYLNLIGHFSVGRALLDIGAANGYFMAQAEKKGWKASGIEISAYARMEAKKKNLTVAESFADLHAPPASFDAITLFDAFEHMPDPDATLRRIHALLRNKGILAINTPDTSSIFARMTGTRWHLIIPPEHLFLFNRKNIALLLEKIGFHVISQRTLGKRFSVRYIARVIANKYPSSRFLSRLADLLARTRAGKFAIRLNLRDNMFILAQKK